MTARSEAARFAARLRRVIAALAIVVGGVGVVAFTVIVIYVVFARYILAQTPYWAEELPRLLLVWVTFIGVISAFVRRSHFQAGFLPLLVSPGRAASLCALLAGLATIAFLIILTVSGWDLAMRTWANRTTALQWPVGLSYLALPVCCSLAAMVVALNLAIGPPPGGPEPKE